MPIEDFKTTKVKNQNRRLIQPTLTNVILKENRLTL